MDKCSGLCRPVSYETTHQWMKCCDCKYKAVQKTYYNDTHERHDNQLDRVNKTCRHAFTALREEKWYCVSPEEKKRLESKYAVWPSDDFCTRIIKENVGSNPPGRGTPYYQNAKADVESEEDWYVRRMHDMHAHLFLLLLLDAHTHARTHTGTNITLIFYLNRWHSRSTLAVEDLYPSENL